MLRWSRCFLGLRERVKPHAITDATAMQRQPWPNWAEAAIAGLFVPQPNLAGRVERIEFTLCGNAMAILRLDGAKNLSQIPIQRFTSMR